MTCIASHRAEVQNPRKWGLAEQEDSIVANDNQTDQKPIGFGTAGLPQCR
jgi:hypothetical protein